MNKVQRISMEQAKLVYILLLILFCTALFVPSSFERDLHGRDELRYAEIVREMRVNKEFLVPRFGGEFYSDKPPVYFWILILSQSVFGKTTFALVLPSMIAGLLGVLLIYLFGKRILKNRYAFLAALALATSVLYFGMAIFLRMDMLLTLLATAASAFFFEGYRTENEKVKSKYYYGFYLLMAMAILIKGPTGFLMPFITAITFLVVTRKWGEFKKIKILLGLGIVLGIIGIWALSIILTGHKDYAYQLFVVQTLGRAVNSFAHKQPIYYYLRVFPGIFLPWTFFLISVFWLFIKQRKALTDVDKYLLCWFIAPFILMSLFSGKLSIYLLPIFPPAALLVARLFESVFENEAKPSYFVVPAAVTLLLLLIIIFVLPKQTQGIPVRSLMKVAVIPYCILGLLAVYGLIKKKFAWVPLAISAMIFVFLSVAMWNILPRVSAGYTKRPIAMELKRLRASGARNIVSFRYYQPEALAYYNGFLVRDIPQEKLPDYLKKHHDAVVLTGQNGVNELSNQYKYKMRVIYAVNKEFILKETPHH